jgi:intracellular sulfur oxidation DsrE/DsrF family protein
MTVAGIHNKVAAIIALLLIAGACPAEYDLYCIGSSYIIDHQYMQSIAESAGIVLKAGRSEIYGNMRTVHALAETKPKDSANPLHELPTGTADVLAMTATRPWLYTEFEAEACIYFSELLLENNPDARIFIHDYWTVLPPDRSLYPELHGWDNVRGMHLGAIKIINLMAGELNHKVYVVPVGAAIQMMREKIAAGELHEYKDPNDLMSDSIHLSEMGRYVQACLTFCGAYRYDVRKLPGDFVGGRGRRRLKFNPHDAAVIHKVVYETVRNTPYSGWYKNEPDSLDAYMEHLKAGLKNWESFDKFYPASGTGSFEGDNGIVWSYTDVDSSKDEETMTDAFIIMRQGSSLSATIPGGIGDLHFAMHKNAEIEVTVDGKSMGIFKPVRQGGWNNHYFKIADLNKTGDVTVKFTCRSERAVMDNISWTAPKPHSKQ